MIIQYYVNPNGEYKQQMAWLLQRDNQQGWPWGTSLQSQFVQRLRQEDHLNAGVKRQPRKQNETLSQKTTVSPNILKYNHQLSIKSIAHSLFSATLDSWRLTSQKTLGLDACIHECQYSFKEMISKSQGWRTLSCHLSF